MLDKIVAPQRAAPPASEGGRDDHPLVIDFAEWVEEHVDAEEVERSLSRCLHCVSWWCKEMSISAVEFAAYAEMDVWRRIFLTGVQACVPLDEDSSLTYATQCCGVPPLPYICAAKATADAVDNMLAVVNLELGGSGQSARAAAPKRCSSWNSGHAASARSRPG